MTDAMRVDVSDLQGLVNDLRLLDAKANKKITAASHQAAQGMVNAARANASWSTGIPPTIRATGSARALKLTAGRNTGRVQYAKVFEFGGRHPLFGNRDHWYPQAKRPYLIPARDAHSEQFAGALADAIVAVLEAH